MDNSNKICKYCVKAYDGTGRLLHHDIAINHEFFTQKLTADEGWPRPEELKFPMNHTFVSNEKGDKYRVILWGIYDREQ